MCLYPKFIRNKKYTSTKKNGGNIPPVNDVRATMVAVGCGSCIECRKQKARGWQVRLLEDIKTNSNGKFITLTFSDESIANLASEINAEGYVLDNAIATLATRRFLERWRKRTGRSLRHWLVTELGHNGTENIHLHGIIWTNEPLQVVEKEWGYGIMWKGKQYTDGRVENYVTERTINYIVKYVTKIDPKHTYYKGIILTSSGIGRNYTDGPAARFNQYKWNDGAKTKEYYRTQQGAKVAMPTYWRNKIYTEEQREALWLEKLDKEERYVCGIRVDISKGEEEYYQLLLQKRKENQEWGYGNDEKDWNKEVYERERRMIMQKTRIAKAEKKKKN